MQITIDIPDDIVQRLDQSNLSQHLLELMVADAYSQGKITTAEVRQLLNLPTRLTVHAFLKRMGIYLNYGESELEQDLQTLKQLRELGLR
jgi:predicted HTH domain antitoxin